MANTFNFHMLNGSLHVRRSSSQPVVHSCFMSSVALEDSANRQTLQSENTPDDVTRVVLALLWRLNIYN